MNAYTHLPRPDTDRLRVALSRVVKDDRALLQRLIIDLRQFSRRKPPLTVAFAFLVMAERALLDAGLPLDEVNHTQLRSYAMDVAEKIASGEGAICRSQAP